MPVISLKRIALAPLATRSSSESLARIKYKWDAHKFTSENSTLRQAVYYLARYIAEELNAITRVIRVRNTDEGTFGEAFCDVIVPSGRTDWLNQFHKGIKSHPMYQKLFAQVNERKINFGIVREQLIQEQRLLEPPDCASGRALAAAWVAHKASSNPSVSKMNASEQEEACRQFISSKLNDESFGLPEGVTVEQ